MSVIIGKICGNYIETKKYTNQMLFRPKFEYGETCISKVVTYSLHINILDGKIFEGFSEGDVVISPQITVGGIIIRVMKPELYTTKEREAHITKRCHQFGRALIRRGKRISRQKLVESKPKVDGTKKRRINGTNKCRVYTVALQTGGVMEQPHIEYINHQTIEACSETEAERLYNIKNNCSYYYGKVVGVDGNITKLNESRSGNSFC